MSDRATDKLSEKSLNEIVSRARQSDHNYFMQMDVDGGRKKVWVGFKDSIECEFNQLYVLYRKIRLADRTIYVCLEVWDRVPRMREFHWALIGMHNKDDRNDLFKDINRLADYGESDHFAIGWPPARRRDDTFKPPFLEFV